MTAVHGSVAAFDSATEEWTEYIERLEFYFAANGITTAAQQRAVLLSCCAFDVLTTKKFSLTVSSHRVFV